MNLVRSKINYGATDDDAFDQYKQALHNPVERVLAFSFLFLHTLAS